MQLIVELYKNKAFMEEFVANYMKFGESRTAAEREYIHAFQIIRNNESNGMHCHPAMNTADIESVKRTMLIISEQGLAFEPRKKEVGITTSNNLSGIVYLDFILCYRGMYKLVGNSEKVLSMSCEIIYDGDTFEWRGAKVEPTYIMHNNRNKQFIMGGFCSFTMSNGTILAYYVDQDEILELQRLSIEATAAMNGNTDMWTGAWKTRSLKAKVFKSAFNTYRSSLLTNKDMINASTEDDNSPSLEGFAKELEKALQAGA
jgi:recombinational DNA repair protein RecT